MTTMNPRFGQPSLSVFWRYLTRSRSWARWWNSNMPEPLKNWGKCSERSCKQTWGPRCTSDLCERCCASFHCYWLGHTMADGTDNEVTLKALAGGYIRPAYSPLPVHYGGAPNSAPEKPKVPEPGKMEEVTNTTAVMLPTPDNSYGGRGTKPGFPISYIN